MAYKGKFVHEITRDDVGKATTSKVCPTCGHKKIIAFRDVLGRVIDCDIGKRIYDVGDGILQIENSEQVSKRLAIGR